MWEERAIVVQHHYVSSRSDAGWQPDARATAPTQWAGAGRGYRRCVVEALRRARLAVDDRVSQLHHGGASLALSHAATFPVTQAIRERAREQVAQKGRIEWPEGERVVVQPCYRSVRFIARVEDEEWVAPVEARHRRQVHALD